MYLRQPRSRPLRFVYLMARRYVRHGVGIQSAALAFYLLFMIFPFSIFFSSLLGLLQLDVESILRQLGQVFPSEVLYLIGAYLRYVGANPSVRLLMFGLAFSVWFPMRAANSLMRAVRTAYRLGPPEHALRHRIKTLVYTVLLIAAVALTLTLMTVGERVLRYAVNAMRLPGALAVLWVQLRFPVMAAVGYFALFWLYALSQDRHCPWRSIWPGTVAALAAWMILSWLYSFYVEHLAHYSLLYGSIGTVIVVLIWLYLSAMVLIMGAECNGVLISMRHGEEADSL